MQTEIVSKTERAALRSIMNGIRRDMAKAVRAEERDLRTEERRREHEQKRWLRIRRQRGAAYEKLLDRAMHGYANILAFARSEDVQALITLRKESNKLLEYGGWVPPRFLFYRATRPSGEAGSRDVAIVFEERSIAIMHGTAKIDEGMDEVDIPFDAPDDEVRDTLAFFLDYGTCDAIAALEQREESPQWTAESLVLSVFYDAAQKKRFRTMAKRAVAAQIAHHRLEK